MICQDSLSHQAREQIVSPFRDEKTGPKPHRLLELDLVYRHGHDGRRLAAGFYHLVPF